MEGIFTIPRLFLALLRYLAHFLYFLHRPPLEDLALKPLKEFL